MDTQSKEELHPEEHNENQAAGTEQHQSHKKGGIHNNALFAASMGRAATAQVDPHNNSGLAQTGTNISYEGATAGGGGGSAGSGYTSGQFGVSTSITAESDFDRANIGSANSDAKDVIKKADDAQDEMNEQQ